MSIYSCLFVSRRLSASRLVSKMPEVEIIERSKRHCMLLCRDSRFGWRSSQWLSGIGSLGIVLWQTAHGAYKNAVEKNKYDHTGRCSTWSTAKMGCCSAAATAECGAQLSLYRLRRLARTQNRCRCLADSCEERAATLIVVNMIDDEITICGRNGRDAVSRRSFNAMWKPSTKTWAPRVSWFSSMCKSTSAEHWITWMCTPTSNLLPTSVSLFVCFQGVTPNFFKGHP